MSDKFGVWDCNDFGVGGKVDKVGCDRVGFGVRVGIVGKVCSFDDDHKDFDLDRVEA